MRKSPFLKAVFTIGALSIADDVTAQLGRDGSFYIFGSSRPSALGMDLYLKDERKWLIHSVRDLARAPRSLLMRLSCPPGFWA